MASFMESVRIGAKSEQLVSKVLEERGWQVTDVTDDVNYRKADIDFVVVPADGGESRTVEVKSDNNISRTGNIFCEVITNVANKTPGWFTSSEATYLCIHDTKNNDIHFLLLDDLREYTKKNYTVEKRFDDWSGNYNKEIVARLVPLNKFKNQYVVQTIEV